MRVTFPFRTGISFLGYRRVEVIEFLRTLVSYSYRTVPFLSIVILLKFLLNTSLLYSFYAFFNTPITFLQQLWVFFLSYRIVNTNKKFAISCLLLFVTNFITPSRVYCTHNGRKANFHNLNLNIYVILPEDETGKRKVEYENEKPIFRMIMITLERNLQREERTTG